MTGVVDGHSPRMTAVDTACPGRSEVDQLAVANPPSVDPACCAAGIGDRAGKAVPGVWLPRLAVADGGERRSNGPFHRGF
jgi:hypothetical protein